MEKKKLTVNDIVFTIECLAEDLPVRGNIMDSGDKDADREAEDKVIKESEWNEWAWCCVKVTAKLAGFEGHDYLGGCSYNDEKDFKQGGYYEDMKNVATDNLYKAIQDARERADSIDFEGFI
jgi:hypothetical protein